MKITIRINSCLSCPSHARDANKTRVECHYKGRRTLLFWDGSEEEARACSKEGYIPDDCPRRNEPQQCRGKGRNERIQKSKERPHRLGNVAFWVRDRCIEKGLPWNRELGKILDAEKEFVAFSDSTPEQWIKAGVAAWKEKKRKGGQSNEH